MKIGIDIRSLMEKRISGVGMYTQQLLHALFTLDTKNEYILFYNSARAVTVPPFAYPHVQTHESTVPSKVMHGSLKFFKRPYLDELIGGVDAFFFPNLQFVAVSKNCKVITTIHDLFFELYPDFCSLKTRWWHASVKPKQLAERSHVVLTVSQNTKNDVMEHYRIKEEKIHVIYSGLPTGLSRVSNQAQLDVVRKKYHLPDEKLIVYLGNIEKRKNIELLIQLAKQNLLPKGYSLVLAGAMKDRQLYDVLKTHISRLQYIGYVDPEDKAMLYTLANIFIYPSFYEGFGFPPLEAMACGTPVIASNTSALPEIIGNAGILINPYNINDASRALELLAHDTQVRDLLIARGYERVKKFTWEETARSVLNHLTL